MRLDVVIIQACFIIKDVSLIFRQDIVRVFIRLLNWSKVLPFKEYQIEVIQSFG